MSRIFPVLFVVALAFLSFVGGAVLTYHQYFPYSLIYQINAGATAWFEENIGALDETTPIEKSDASATAGTEKVSTDWTINVLKPEHVSNELLMVCPRNAPEIHLLNTRGEFIRKWTMPKKIRSKGRFVRALHIYPNGDMLLLLSRYTGSLFRVKQNGELVWELDKKFHHDVGVDSKGNIYALSVQTETTGIKEVPGILTPFMHDYLYQISPEGKVVKKISMIKAFLNSPVQNYLDFLSVRSAKGDITHHNTVSVLTEDLASAFPQFKPGYILLSGRFTHTISVLNPQTGKMVWAAKGPWRKQHDAEFLPNGNMMLFDNSGADGKPKRSRVLEISATTGEVVSEYGDKQAIHFHSYKASNQQVLSNGNLLINSSVEGRIIEYSKEHGVVRDIQNKSYGDVMCMYGISPQTREQLGI